MNEEETTNQRNAQKGKLKDAFFFLLLLPYRISNITGFPHVVFVCCVLTCCLFGVLPHGTVHMCVASNRKFMIMITRTKKNV